MHSETVSDAIEPLIADELIDDILFQVKSGKEATIYCCSGGVRSRVELLAVKVYKAQRFRAFRDDSIYQAGRVILDRRSARAAAKRTRFGRAQRRRSRPRPGPMDIRPGDRRDRAVAGMQRCAR